MKQTKIEMMKWVAAGMILGTGLVGIQSFKASRATAHPFDWMIPDAEARKPLNSFNFGTAAGQGDFIRFLYFMVNGVPEGSGYTLMGPDGGLVGMVKQMTNKLGGALRRAGYPTCEDIPANGETSETITKDGISMTMRMAFGPGTQTIPSGYSGAGNTFAKRVSVFRGDDQVMVFEMTCAGSSGIRTGYIVADKDMMKEPFREVKRGMEIYFQKNENTSASQVDMLQVAEGSASNGEKLAVTFTSPDGDAFELWMIRTTNIGGDSFGVRGSRSSNQARLSSIHSTPASAPFLSNTDTIESVNSTNITATLGVFTSCIDFTGVDPVSAGSGCATINAHSSNAKFNNSEPSWTIQGIGAATITDLNP
jgi:hypothetical protein